MSLSHPAARIRGVATGLLTAALAVAAHTVGGGAPPTGAAAVQLAVLAATVGALAAILTRATQARVLVGLLAAGQLLGHLMLGAVGHHHTVSAAPPAAAMLAAHLAAITVGAGLIAAGDRLWRAVSRAVRAVVRVVCPPVGVVAVVAARRADQPLRSALLLAASVSHRGPPVGFTA
jgi:hypothetical protein